MLYRLGIFKNKLKNKIKIYLIEQSQRQIRTEVKIR